MTLWCVSCFVCSALGPVATKPERGARPPKNSGFIYRAIGEVAGWMCAECDWKYRTMLPPATRGDCLDGPRPCRALLCKFNLWFDTSRKADKALQVLETCALDVADRGEHTLRSVGEVLRMTREGTRYIILNAVEKMQSIPGIEVDFDELIRDDGDEDEGGAP